MEKITSITISRQMGSGGTFIGYHLAKELGFKYLDREILRQAADNLEIEPMMLEKYDGKATSILERIINSFCFGTPEMTGAPMFKKPVYDRELFAMESKIIREITGQCSAVIIGRGGFYILKDQPDTFHIFIHAPLDYRVERIMKARKIGKQEAQNMIQESDRTRTKFIRDMLGIDWMDARNFHLSLDSSVIGISACVEIITKLVKKEV
jgi:CMP/dCMP kinase